MKKPRFAMVTIFFLIAVGAFYTGPVSGKTQPEYPVIEIALKGFTADSNSEISGLAWYNDNLVFLPQYSEINQFKPENKPKLYTLKKSEIMAYLDAFHNHQDVSPLDPKEIDIVIEEGLLKKLENIKGFEGLEALGFRGNTVFVAVEASPDRMEAYLIKGEITPDLTRITFIEKDNPMPRIPPQADIDNASYETLIVTNTNIIVLYEGNGKLINPSAKAYVFDFDLNFLCTIPFPNIEYRVTDATGIDGKNRFWCINYLWPDDKERSLYKPAPDSISKKFGKGRTHLRSEKVERLVEFEYIPKGKDSQIKWVKKPPIQLELLGVEKGNSRNWEGLVRLDNMGFLVITDRYPRTILGFVPLSLSHRGNN